MMTSSNGKISALLAICAGNFLAQRPVTRSFDVFFDLPPNKRLNKQWGGSWFETPSCPLWRHCNDIIGTFDYWWRPCEKLVGELIPCNITLSLVACSTSSHYLNQRWLWWHCSKHFSQWQCCFMLMLHCHWRDSVWPGHNVFIFVLGSQSRSL